MASLNLRGTGNVQSYLLVIPSPGEESQARVSMKRRKGCTSVTVRETDGVKTRIVLSDDGVRLM
jgi:hypothetical protein